MASLRPRLRSDLQSRSSSTSNKTSGWKLKFPDTDVLKGIAADLWSNVYLGGFGRLHGPRRAIIFLCRQHDVEPTKSPERSCSKKIRTYVFSGNLPRFNHPLRLCGKFRAERYTWKYRSGCHQYQCQKACLSQSRSDMALRRNGDDPLRFR